MLQGTEAYSHPLSIIVTPDARFDNMYLNIVSPLPPSKAFTYLLTCINQFIHWSEVIPIVNITMETVTQAIVNGWISRFGVLSTISTDHGSYFESRLWNSLIHFLGSKCTRTTSYHPITSGLIKCFYRQLKHPQRHAPLCSIVKNPYLFLITDQCYLHKNVGTLNIKF